MAAIRKSTNAANRRLHELNIGSTATSGVTTMRPAESAFGRFKLWFLASVRRTFARNSAFHGFLCERLQYQLADGTQRLEDAVARNGDGLEVLSTLEPLHAFQLLHEHLAGVV